ncbi:MAG: hypothetical protein ABIL76_03760, partial [candidate division WOR-3 bacterium]
MDWKLKLKALLHDPPYKAKFIKTHYDEAEKLFQKIFPNESLKEDIVSISDKLSFAQSRVIIEPNFNEQNKKDQFEKSSQVDYHECQFIDIFSKRKEPIQSPDEEKVKKLFEKLGNLTFQ